MYERAPEYREGEQDFYSERPENLKPLNDLRGWELGPEYPDIRGYALHDRNDDKIGTIDDFLVNTDNGEIVFAIISYGGVLGLGDKKTLIPLDHLDLRREDKRAYTDMTKEDLDNVPEYKKDVKGFGMFYDYWSGRREPAMAEERGKGYEDVERRGQVIPEVEEHLEATKFREKTGEVEVHKEVETHPETVRGKVAKTRVYVTRRDVEPGREVKPGEQTLREGETVSIPVVEEHLRAEKKAEVTGEVEITPEMIEEEEEITEDVRKERVHIEGADYVDEEESEAEERERTRRSRGY